MPAAKPKLPIIMMTAFGTTETAIEATKLGAYDYVLKPFDTGELLDLIAKAVASSRREIGTILMTTDSMLLESLPVLQPGGGEAQGPRESQVGATRMKAGPGGGK